MTLLVDRLRTDEKLAGLEVEDADVAKMLDWFKSDYLPVYEISNVAEYLKASGADFGSLTDFPNVAPPHIAYWMEWARPDRLVSFDFDNQPERVAVLFWQQEPPEAGVWKISAHAWGMWRNRRPEPLVSWSMEFDLNATPSITDTRIMPGINAMFCDDHAPTGEGARIPKAASLSEARRLVEEYKLKEAEAKAELEKIESRLDEVIEVWIRLAVLYPTLMAHSLLACRNVEEIDNPPHPRLSKSFKKRHGKCLISFKTLAISAMGSRQQEGPSGLGSEKRLHIMRGHFKTFTAERPLFGRAVGTYWWSPGLRGNAERGAVVKDYAISAPPVVSDSRGDEE